MPMIVYGAVMDLKKKGVSISLLGDAEETEIKVFLRTVEYEEFLSRFYETVTLSARGMCGEDRPLVLVSRLSRAPCAGQQHDGAPDTPDGADCAGRERLRGQRRGWVLTRGARRARAAVAVVPALARRAIAGVWRRARPLNASMVCVCCVFCPSGAGELEVKLASVVASLDQYIIKTEDQVASERTCERASERANKSERANERASERANERASERAIERVFGSARRRWFSRVPTSVRARGRRSMYCFVVAG